MNSVIFKTEYFLSGIWRAVSKQGSFGDLIHWFHVDRGLIRVKKIKIRFPEKYSDLCGANLKIRSIKHTFLEITKASLFLKYNVIYSTFTKDYFFSLFYSLIFLLWTQCSPQIAVRSTVLSRNQSMNTFDIFTFSLSFSLYF